MVVAIAAFIVHVFIPDIAWLEKDEQERLVSWYNNAISPSSLPVLVANAWVVAAFTLWLSRKNDKGND